MSDNLENFIRNNRDAFDAQVPSDQIWTNIQTGLAQQAAVAGTTAASSTAAGAAKSGLGKIALGWKITAVVAISAIVGTGIFFATRDNGSGTDGAGKGSEKLANVETPGANAAPTTQVEYLYAGSSVVTPPMPGVDVPYMTFSVSAAEGGTWSAPTGTELKVPAGIFVDAQGQPITGDVEIRYREFHDAEDIILSGITMKYTENGANENFQTAGMMEILGYQGSKQVYIAPGKGIDVKMASFTPEDNYDLYFLNAKDGWKDIGKAKLSKNKEKEEALALIASKPRPPLKGKPEEMDGEVMFNAKHDEFPELKPFKGVRWMAEDLKEYKKIEDQLISKVWNDVKLEELDDEGLRYRITLSNKHRVSLSLDVKPILEGDDYEKGMARFRDKMETYNRLLEKKGIDEERLATQASVFRTFTISGFGIYNCDRYGRGLSTKIYADYDFPDDEYTDPKTTIIFHIAGDNRSVVNLMPGERERLDFFPWEKNILLIVMPGNKVAVCKNENFQNLKNFSTHKFTFEPLEGEVHSALDLRKLLGV